MRWWRALCVSHSVEPSAIGANPRGCLINHLLWHGPIACRHTLRGHTQWVVSLAAVQDIVYSGSDDGTIRKWSTATGSSLGGFVAHYMPVTALAASTLETPALPAGGGGGGRDLGRRDDAWLASGSGELKIKLWRRSRPAGSTDANWHPCSRGAPLERDARADGGESSGASASAAFEGGPVISLAWWIWHAWQRLPTTPQRLRQRLLQAWESTPLVAHSWWRGARPRTLPPPHTLAF